MATDDIDGLNPNIVAAFDEVLVPDMGDPALFSRLRRLVKNCLADNYDQSDVLAVIELAIEKCNGDAEDDNGA